MADIKTYSLGQACRWVHRLTTAEARLRTLYVAEGSALGGWELGRNLARLFPSEATAGRRFFRGRSGATGAAWRGYLSPLSAGAGNPTARPRIIDAAQETFAVFERWLAGWSGAAHE